MPNMAQKLKKHNKKIINFNRPNPEPLFKCKCPVNECPLDGKCQEVGIVYGAKIISVTGGTQTYTGVTKNRFRIRNDTTLSEYI